MACLVYVQEFANCRCSRNNTIGDAEEALLDVMKQMERTGVLQTANMLDLEELVSEQLMDEEIKNAVREKCAGEQEREFDPTMALMCSPHVVRTKCLALLDDLPHITKNAQHHLHQLVKACTLLEEVVTQIELARPTEADASRHTLPTIIPIVGLDPSLGSLPVISSLHTRSLQLPLGITVPLTKERQVAVSNPGLRVEDGAQDVHGIVVAGIMVATSAANARETYGINGKRIMGAKTVDEARTLLGNSLDWVAIRKGGGNRLGCRIEERRTVIPAEVDLRLAASRNAALPAMNGVTIDVWTPSPELEGESGGYCLQAW
ncbi:hypothetical protein B0H17DRAFT_1132506 [Mycena rosella]|uniref:Uncharacterized protein n=1 Tax=Mycena rosella TaxID=1033263 RepID=A0AAD7GG55_MYCRO|nr:hypothetical protein B0H17DRAFT_1132506 [Mycena rosella]